MQRASGHVTVLINRDPGEFTGWMCEEGEKGESEAM
jgi:hypothetical protein